MSEIKNVNEVDVNMKACATEGDIVFYDVIENDVFDIKGLAFFSKEKQYYRIPLSFKKKVTEAVAWLANQPSGGQIRFKSNSRKVAIKITNKGDYQMCHMTCTGQQGADIYYKNKNTKGKYLFYSCTKFEVPTININNTVFEQDENEETEFIVNMPLYEGVEKFEIGLEKNATLLKPTPFKKDGKVVVYGTSINQGGCASRPGMLYTNILSRKFDIEFINLGFSGSGLGEVELAQIINEIDNKKLIILDYEANGGATGDMKNNLDQFINTLREASKDIPIIVMSKLKFASDVLNKASIARRNFYFNFQKNMVKMHRKNGDKNIYFVDGSKLLGSKDIHEFFVDGVHPTDLGFYVLAKNTAKKIRKFIK